tara:strand:+ start:263 stop:802 length:540 start_codon:yes stop_codon:yes gene_type:complete
MSLFHYSITTSVIFSVLGFLAFARKSSVCPYMLSFARSTKASVLLLTLSLAWFLFRYVQNLSEADFGNYKLVIGLVAIFIFFGSFALVKDFLAVRSLSILCLFYAREVLDSAWLQDPPARLFLVTITYILIVSALYFGAWPYRFRDFFEWLAENSKRVQILSVLLSIIGLTMLALSFTL